MYVLLKIYCMLADYVVVFNIDMYITNKGKGNTQGTSHGNNIKKVSEVILLYVTYNYKLQTYSCSFAISYIILFYSIY